MQRNKREEEEGDVANQVKWETDTPKNAVKVAEPEEERLFPHSNFFKEMVLNVDEQQSGGDNIVRGHSPPPPNIFQNNYCIASLIHPLKSTKFIYLFNLIK
jgi:hypothetical protein